MKMRIIGHRGAAALASENTVAAIKAGIAAGVDAVEFDIRVTSDRHLVLGHDPDFLRTCGDKRKVAEMTLAEVRNLRSFEGEPIPSLSEALAALGTTPVLIEGKDSGWARPLAALLQNDPKRYQYTVISFSTYELSSFHSLCPEVKVYVLENHSGMDAVDNARIYGFNGIDLNYWTINPLVYWLARRHKLDICVYTVNNIWMAHLLRLLYLNISLTTNVPHKMQFLRPKAKRPPRKKANK